MMEQKYLYRYESASEELDDSPTLYEFEIVKITPKGYWFSIRGGLGKKWVSKLSKSSTGKKTFSNGKKRYAYPTKKEAWESFVIRKMRYVENCLLNLEKSERQYAAIKRNADIGGDSDVIAMCDECLKGIRG